MNAFVDYQTSVIDLVGKKQYDESLELMERAKALFPDKCDRLGHWKANVYCLQGKGNKALAELQEVIEGGLWWNPEILSSDPELDAVKETNEFKQLLEQCDTSYRANLEAAQPLLKVDGNESAEVAIFSLHWKASNVEDFSLEWRDKRLLTDYLIGFPQSSQMFSYNCFSWDDFDQTMEDVRRTYSRFTKNRESESEVIISGASQGGGRAIELSLGQEALFESFIAVVPAFEDLNRLEDLARTNNRKVRGCIITGNHDPFYEDVLKAVSIFEKHSIPCKLIVIEGMGHKFPEDFPATFQEAVQFVLR
ncbi:hypothetical protein [Guptibacillus algicola]|uniref:hypothetical protein n=1 Tax=Guptibacillus algicola TaxID=225844 RepID=UPI001CD46E9F|nr:hypothetical protein [Alkalihalobacillus algicola]MCA0988815.1 hypothetical protein [Alkalihalobacillus algicola]